MSVRVNSARVHYAHSTGSNLGPPRYDVNALWDYSAHDISIFNYLFDSSPVNVSARRQKCLGTERDDLAFGTFRIPQRGNTVAPRSCQLDRSPEGAADHHCR